MIKITIKIKKTTEDARKVLECGSLLPLSGGTATFKAAEVRRSLPSRDAGGLARLSSGAFCNGT